MSAMASAAGDEGFKPLCRNPSGSLSFRSGAEVSEITGALRGFVHEQASCAPGTLPPPKVCNGAAYYAAIIWDANDEL
jgi:hypothetical protein